MFYMIKKIRERPTLLLMYIRLFFIYRTIRFRKGFFRIFKKKFVFVDSASFVSMYVDIFINEAYGFKAENSHPLIIDCGANIGLSVLYFKTLYQDAIIEAFEPDENIFDVLKSNCATFDLKNVTLINKGVWINDKGVAFSPDGADGGKIEHHILKDDSPKIKTVRLKELLEARKKIDLLKIDIEAAEVDVLHDCKDSLSCVDLLFVEYHSLADGEQKLDELLTILKNAGFRWYINSLGRSPKNYFLYRGQRSGFDLQLNIYARRV